MTVTSGTETHSANVTDYLAKSGDTLIRISLPFHSGERQSVELFGNNEQIAKLVGIPIVENPDKYNFNYWSGMTAF